MPKPQNKREIRTFLNTVHCQVSCSRLTLHVQTPAVVMWVDEDGHWWTFTPAFWSSVLLIKTYLCSAHVHVCVRMCNSRRDANSCSFSL